VVPGPTAQDVDAYKAAVAAKHLLPDDQGSAWPLLDKLRGELPPEQVFIQENALRVALEDQAQQVLLRYLAGDQTPQTKAEFDNGAKYMQAALRLTQESLYLEGRSDFFQGRGLLYDKQYAQAATLLEQAVRIDPAEAMAITRWASHIWSRPISPRRFRPSATRRITLRTGPIRCTISRSRRLNRVTMTEPYAATSRR